MSNESLGPTRRTLLTALGAVAVNALVPLTAFAGRRHHGCCSPCRSYGVGGISITSPKANLVIDDPSGKSRSVIGSVLPFPNVNGATNWRVIVTIQAALLGTGDVTATEAVPEGWYGHDFQDYNAGSFTIANVVAANGLPTGNIMGSPTWLPFYVSAISQMKVSGSWLNYSSGSNPLYGHVPTP
jgi:hypothetical protein